MTANARQKAVQIAFGDVPSTATVPLPDSPMYVDAAIKARMNVAPATVTPDRPVGERSFSPRLGRKQQCGRILPTATKEAI